MTSPSSDEAIKAYAESLPTFYQEILKAFPTIDPDRHLGYGLALTTLMGHFQSPGPVPAGNALERSRFGGMTLPPLAVAVERLKDAGLVEVKNRMFVHPTAAGERVIAALTGREPSVDPVPELPPLPPELQAAA